MTDKLKQWEFDRGYAKGKADVLDKIRAEIDDAKMPKNRMSFFRDGINCALEIIDKYRGVKIRNEDSN